jgi:hypothetical protein
LFKQQLMKQTSSLGWPSWSNYFFSFFLAPVAKKSLKNINLYVVVYKANGRLANPYCFWSPTQKKKETYTWSSQPVKWQAGWLHPCRPAGQVPCTVAGKWFSTNSKKWHQTKLSHRRPAPAPSFRFPIRA